MSDWREAATSGQRTSATRRSEPPSRPPYGPGHSCHGWNESTSPAWFSAITRSMLSEKERGGRLATGRGAVGGWSTPSAVPSAAATGRPWPQSELSESTPEATRCPLAEAFRRRADRSVCCRSDAPSMVSSADLLCLTIFDVACSAAATDSLGRSKSEAGIVPTYHRWPPLLERHSLWRHRRKICPIPFTVIWAPLLI